MLSAEHSKGQLCIKLRSSSYGFRFLLLPNTTMKSFFFSHQQSKMEDSKTQHSWLDIVLVRQAALKQFQVFLIAIFMKTSAPDI